MQELDIEFQTDAEQGVVLLHNVLLIFLRFFTGGKTFDLLVELVVLVECMFWVFVKDVRKLALAGVVVKREDIIFFLLVNFLFQAFFRAK